MTHVLFLDHPEADFGSAVVFLGLHQLLGGDNVVDFPFKKSFHGEVHEYPSPYSRAVWPDDLSKIQPWQRPAIGAPDDIGKTGPFAWMPNLPGRAWSENEVLGGLRDKIFDFIVITPRLYNTDCLRHLTRKLGGPAALPPIALLDGEDYQDIRWDYVDEFKPVVYLKRELLNNVNDSRCRVEPFPLASPIPERPPVEKDIDVLFLGGGTWPGRDSACNALRQAFGDKFVGGVGVHYNYPDYLDAIARAKVAVSVRGWGWDSLRRYEIPAMPGTLMVADRQPVIRPYDFNHGENVLLFEDARSLVENVREALDNESKRAYIAALGNVHLKHFHSAKARAKQLIASALR